MPRTFTGQSPTQLLEHYKNRNSFRTEEEGSSEGEESTSTEEGGDARLDQLIEMQNTQLALLEEINASLDKLVGGDEVSAESEEEVAALTDASRILTAEIQNRNHTIERRQASQTLARQVAQITEAQSRRRPAVGSSRILPANVGSAVHHTGRVDEMRVLPREHRRHAPVTMFRDSEGISKEVKAFRFGVWALALAKAELGAHKLPRTDFEQHAKFLAEHKEASGHASGGEYLVPDEFSSDLIELKLLYGTARRLFRPESMKSDTKRIPRRTGQMTAYVVAESAATTESNTTHDEVVLTAFDVNAIGRITSQLDQDSIVDVGNLVAQSMSWAFALLEDTILWNGDGTAAHASVDGFFPKMLDVDGGGTDAYNAMHIGDIAWTAITLAHFHDMLGRLPDYADVPGQVTWVCHRAFYHGVMLKLELAAGGTDKGHIDSGDTRPRPQFLGYPVEFVNVMPKVKAANQQPVAIGNWHQVGAFGDRQKESIAFSDSAVIGGESVFERNQTAIRLTERIAGNIHDLGDAATEGPAVSLLLTA